MTLKEANALVSGWHRHHKPVVGQRWSIGAIGPDGMLHGAAIVGRPVARMTDAREVAEVTRLVTDGAKNACSLLYSACARAAAAMGFERIQTFILESETGVSLRAAGWAFEGMSRGGSWSTPSRARTDNHPTGPKQRWARQLRG